MSEATQYTLGPWREIRDSNGVLSEICGPCMEHANCRKTVVFRVTHDLPDWISRSREEHVEACICEANASLIIAAPDLYEAIMALRSFMWAEGYADQNIPMAQADAAIAKAEGR